MDLVRIPCLIVGERTGSIEKEGFWRWGEGVERSRNCPNS